MKHKPGAVIKTAGILIFLLLTICMPAQRAGALTPSGTVINIPNLSVSSDAGAVAVSQPANPPSLALLAVSGVAWTATGTDSQVATGQTIIYNYRFAHNGNIGIAPAKDTFYITVSGSWLQGVYQDAACTLPAAASVQLPPNAGNTYSFYVKVAAPVNAVGQSSLTTVTVENEYRHTNSANDAFGDPDIITHSVLTSVPDNVPPALAITTPVHNSNLAFAISTLTGTTEVGATGFYSVSPSGANGALTIDGTGAFSQNVGLTQGQNIISVTVQDAFANPATMTKTVFVDSIAPVAAITSPAAGQAVSGTIPITGSATDTHFVEYSLYYGPGLVPTAWRPITATTTVSVDNNVLGMWNTSTLYGDYVLRLTVLDSFGNVSRLDRTVSVGNSGVFTGTLPVDKWTMVSVPGIPYNPDPSTWFGSGRIEVQRWDPTMSAPDPYLSQYRRSFAVTAGSGFWVKPYDTPINYTVSAWVPNTTQEFAIPVSAGWNQIGNPYNRGILWDYFTYRNTSTGEVKTLSDAIAAGWIDASYYEYAGNNYTQHGAGESMDPQDGYFIKTYVNGQLIINPGAGMPNGVAKIIRPQYEWKMQLSAASPDLKDTDNFAGVLTGGSDGLDPADSGEPPLVDKHLTLYFPHEDWPDRQAGRYASDVRPQPQAPTPSGLPVKTWTFAVETSEPGAPVTVSWPNAAFLPANYDFEITDETTGAKLDPRITPSFQYTAAAGAERRFSLRARKLGLLPQVELSTSLLRGWNLISVPLEPEQTDARAQLADDLPNPMIYQYSDLKYFDPDSKDRVDIQAGIGYWLYVDNPTQVDFKGVPTSAGTPVEVPLVSGWNLIGNPYASPATFGDNIKITCEREKLPLSQAVARGCIEGRVFRYDAATGGYETLGQGASLLPWQGYIIKALQPCSITFE